MAIYFIGIVTFELNEYFSSMLPSLFQCFFFSFYFLLFFNIKFCYMYSIVVFVSVENHLVAHNTIRHKLYNRNNAKWNISEYISYIFLWVRCLIIQFFILSHTHFVFLFLLNSYYSIASYSIIFFLSFCFCTINFATKYLFDLVYFYYE